MPLLSWWHKASRYSTRRREAESPSLTFVAYPPTLWVVGLGDGSTLLPPCAVRFTLGARPATASHSPVPSPVGFAACPLPFGLLRRPARRGLRYLAHGLNTRQLLADQIEGTEIGTASDVGCCLVGGITHAPLPTALPCGVFHS